MTYAITGPNPGQTATETTTVLSSDSGGNFVLDRLRTDNAHTNAHTTESYSDTGTQLLFNGETDVVNQAYTVCTPGVVVLQTPLLTLQTFQSVANCVTRNVSDNTLVASWQQKDTFVSVNFADVIVPAGTFTNVIYLRHSVPVGGPLGGQTDDLYIAPGVGIARTVSTVGGRTQISELTGGTIGGQPVTAH